jgi:hypothetical protein
MQRAPLRVLAQGAPAAASSSLLTLRYVRHSKNATVPLETSSGPSTAVLLEERRCAGASISDRAAAPPAAPGIEPGRGADGEGAGDQGEPSIAEELRRLLAAADAAAAAGGVPGAAGGGAGDRQRPRWQRLAAQPSHHRQQDTPQGLEEGQGQAQGGQQKGQQQFPPPPQQQQQPPPQQQQQQQQQQRQQRQRQRPRAPRRRRAAEAAAQEQGREPSFQELCAFCRMHAASPSLPHWTQGAGGRVGAGAVGGPGQGRSLGGAPAAGPARSAC